MTTQPATNRRSLALVVSLAALLSAASAGSAQAPQGATPPAAPRPPRSVLGATPAPQRVPAPGPATDQPYAPQAIPAEHSVGLFADRTRRRVVKPLLESSTSSRETNTQQLETRSQRSSFHALGL